MITTIDLTKLTIPASRDELRKWIINIFLDEIPGTGKGELCSRYEYIAFRYDSSNVILKRPAQFNNGFDFTIHVTGYNFNPRRSTTRPTHDNIISDLREKANENAKMYEKLSSQIDNIFQCQPYDSSEITFSSGLPVILLLEVVKWLFVEQDVTYWNYSGRQMFYNAIKVV